ncbi:MAG: hypothetical protein Q8N77_02080 [Nanoarchaeota archaeon]|nr:hypothetical protein [Nanoarchaeota archaeon]
MKIVGVEHNPEFFDKHQQFLEKMITQSDAVMLEGITNGHFWQDIGGFSGSLSDIACSQQKKIYQADPRTMKTTYIDAAQTAVGLYFMFSPGELSPLYTLPLALYLTSGTLLGIILRYSPKAIASLKKGTEMSISNNYETLLYGETDYANVMIAKGISKISQKSKNVKKLVCFHGEAHSKPIHAYLKHPAFRKFKQLLYLPTYEPFSETKVREYTSTSEGMWRLSRQI